MKNGLLRLPRVLQLGRGLSLVGVLLLALATSGLVRAQTIDTKYEPYAVTSVAGNPAAGAADGTGSAALFNQAAGVARDSAGNLYIADSLNHTIRKVTPAGVVTTLAGAANQTGSADGTGAAARFTDPSGIAIDTNGILYVADTGNDTIRKVTPAGVVTTLAGGAGSPGYADGTGAAARFDGPIGITVAPDGNILVADTNNNVVRKITPAGVVTTLAGAWKLPNRGFVNGTGTNASFNLPRSIARDASGNFYIVDTGNHIIRKMTASGVVTTLAGKPGVAGSADGTGAGARFNNPFGVTVDASGNLFVTDMRNHTIRKITPTGVVTTFAGTPEAAGSADGTGAAASFNFPFGITVDASGNLFVTEYNNHTIRKITSAGVVSTVAGKAGLSGSTDDTGEAARFSKPTGVVVDGSGNLFVADSGNHAIRKVTPAGAVSTFAGVVGVYGALDGKGNKAYLTSPYSIAIDAGGVLYITEIGVSTQASGETIRKIAADGTVTTLAGMAGVGGYKDGTGTAAYFSVPSGIAVGSGGDLFVVDNANSLIRKVTSAGVVTTFAGSVGNAGFANGTGSAALFNAPVGVAADAGGNVYVADSNNNAIRRINAQGAVTTYSGSPADSTTYRDGAGTVARFLRPAGLALDNAGNLFVADTRNHVIRKIAPDSVVTTVAGKALTIDMVDGTGDAARFNQPVGLAIDLATGDLYVADSGNSAVRRVTAAREVTTIAGSGARNSTGKTDGTGSAARFLFPAGIAVDPVSGDYFVADRMNHVIRRVTPAGVVSLYAGVPGTNGVLDGSRLVALFNAPAAVAVSATGVVYVADTGSSTIRRIAADGTVTTLAGAPLVPGVDNGTGSAARFSSPSGIVLDAAGNLYVADSGNSTIRKVTDAGVVTTFSGVGAGNADGAATAARFNTPRGLSIDAAGNLYVADQGNRLIRKVATDGSVTTLAGSSYNNGNRDGVRANAWFTAPSATAVDSAGNVYVTDEATSTIRRVTADGIVTTLAGSPFMPGSSDGSGYWARFYGPQGIAIDGQGRLIVSDTTNNMIRRAVKDTSGTGGTGPGTDSSAGSSSGNTSSPTQSNNSTIGGTTRFLFPIGVTVDSAGSAHVTDASYNMLAKVTATAEFSVSAGAPGFAGMKDGVGANALFNQPGGAVVDSAGNVYVADAGNATIRKVAADGTVTTIAGSATSRGNTDGTGTAASFSAPTGIALDKSGNLYIADATAATIRKIAPGGVVTTLAGSPFSRGANDGTGTGARFNYPTSVAVDGAGVLYVADTYNHTIRKVSAAGVVTTLAGLAGVSGSDDGTGIAALFNQPMGIAVDASGNVFVADTGNQTIRKITAAGVVTTPAGLAGVAGSTDGTGTAALFNQPRGIAVDSTGTLYVADTGNAAFRKVASGNVVSTPTLVNPTTPTTPTTPTPPDQVSGSGSGGGALPAWFAAAFGLLLLARWTARRN